MSDSRTTDIVARKGGVMTDEVGAITGDLTLRTEVDDNSGVVLRVQYKEADEWYVVTGGPTTLGGRDIDAIHAEAVTQLGRGQE